MVIRFNKPYFTGKELEYVRDAIERQQLSGNGPYTQKCEAWLEAACGSPRVLLTHSATAALEMGSLLLDLKPGDEVIMPSYTFVSTANAFALRGAVPVFIDIRPDTLNMNETLIEGAVNSRTKAVVPVHYGGTPCAMSAIKELADRRGLGIIEDAAHAIGAMDQGRALGTFGHLGVLSFHETKNLFSGEGGALLINDPGFIERAVHLREKGTNRKEFLQGDVSKYEWIDIGSSYAPSDMVAAFLFAQLEQAEPILEMRRNVWMRYHHHLRPLAEAGCVELPALSGDRPHNAHVYYILLESEKVRSSLIEALSRLGIRAVFHYMPLHDSPMGRKLGRCGSEMKVTDDIARRLLRLPMGAGLDYEDQNKVIEAVYQFFGQRCSPGPDDCSVSPQADEGTLL